MLVCDCGRLQVFEIVGKMAKGWINNNILRRSCCVHHVSTGVEHNCCEVRPEEEEWRKDSCYNTWSPHSTWTPHTTHGHHTAHGRHTQHMDTTCVHTNTLTPLIIEIGLCRYVSPMRFDHQKDIPHRCMAYRIVWAEGVWAHS